MSVDVAVKGLFFASGSVTLILTNEHSWIVRTDAESVTRRQSPRRVDGRGKPPPDMGLISVYSSRALFLLLLSFLFPVGKQTWLKGFNSWES